MRRLSLVFMVIVLVAMAMASTASAHIPYVPSHQVGCIITSDPWAVGADGNPLTPPFGPFDGAAVAAAAPSNTCGNK